MIGFIVPFPGAIVRYKAIAELLLLAGVIAFMKQRDPLDYKYI
jgi:hypothetical protein